jgi:hypothetical protein
MFESMAERLLVPLAVVITAIRVGMVAAPPYDRAAGLFDDDAFYYFGIARHLAAGDGSTFNGLDPTNGYHPLWQLLLVPVFAGFEGNSENRAALVAVTVLSGLLFVASAAVLSRLGRVVEAPARLTVAAVPLLLAGTAGPSLWFSGMETGLLLLGLLAVALAYARTGGLAAVTSARAAAGLGVLVALVVLARLDAVFPMALLGLVALARWWRRPRLVAAAAAPPAALLAGYLAGNVVLFDTALPVSGQAKALDAGPDIGPNIGPGLGALQADVLHQFLAAPAVFGVPCWFGLLALLAVPAAVALGRLRPVLSPAAAAAQFGLIVLVGGLLTVGYYALTSSWRLWPWYFYAAPLSIALAGPALLMAWPQRRPQRRPAAWQAVALAGCVAVVAAVAAQAVRVSTGSVVRAAFVEAGPAVAARLAAVAPPHAPLAMGDRAGSVGYHLDRLDRPMVHLEGLVNSAAYLDALRAGTVPQFLASRGVALYARATDPFTEPATELARDGCHRFVEPTQGDGLKTTIVVCDADLVLNLPLPDGTAYRVWRYLPERNLNR